MSKQKIMKIEKNNLIEELHRYTFDREAMRELVFGEALDKAVKQLIRELKGQGNTENTLRKHAKTMNSVLYVDPQNNEIARIVGGLELAREGLLPEAAEFKKKRDAEESAKALADSVTATLRIIAEASSMLTGLLRTIGGGLWATLIGKDETPKDKGQQR